MPFVAAFVGWSTKIVALEMLYRPMEFKGIGLIGWQGIVPRRAGKVGSKTIELLTQNLLKPEELLEKVDAREAVDALREPLTQAVDEISRDIAEQIRPGLWDSLPDAARKAIMPRVHDQTLDSRGEDAHRDAVGPQPVRRHPVPGRSRHWSATRTSSTN